MNKKPAKRTKKSSNIGKIQKIEWEDHYSIQGWQKTMNTDPVKVTSVGQVVAEDAKVVLLAQSWTAEDGSGNHKGIIKKCIISRKDIK